jgi:hypothetical protein
MTVGGVEGTGEGNARRIGDENPNVVCRHQLRNRSCRMDVREFAAIATRADLLDSGHDPGDQRSAGWSDPVGDNPGDLRMQ